MFIFGGFYFNLYFSLKKKLCCLSNIAAPVRLFLKPQWIVWDVLFTSTFVLLSSMHTWKEQQNEWVATLQKNNGEHILAVNGEFSSDLVKWGTIQLFNFLTFFLLTCKRDFFFFLNADGEETQRCINHRIHVHFDVWRGILQNSSVPPFAPSHQAVKSIGHKKREPCGRSVSQTIYLQ